MAKQQKPIAEGLFTWPSNKPHLIGGRHKTSGKVVFPMPRGKEAEFYEAIELKDRGTLWSYTVQRFLPKSPPYAGPETKDTFKPYALGYIELPGQVIVEGRIVVDDFDRLKIGMPMELTIERFKEDAEGNELMMYAFRPAA